MSDALMPVPIPPLGIAVDGPGRYRVANTVAGLVDLLVNNWPIREKREAWRAALAACLQALEGNASGDEVREVFILAAKDAEFTLILEPAAVSSPQSGVSSIALH